MYHLSTWYIKNWYNTRVEQQPTRCVSPVWHLQYNVNACQMSWKE